MDGRHTGAILRRGGHERTVSLMPPIKALYCQRKVPGLMHSTIIGLGKVVLLLLQQALATIDQLGPPQEMCICGP